MNDFVNEFETRFDAPSAEEIDQLIAKAHSLRQEVTRDALVGLWGLLRRSVGRKGSVAMPSHA